MTPFLEVRRMSNIDKKQIILLLIVAITAIGVWFGGPYLNLFNQHPLYSAEKRCYVIALLFLTWILIYLLMTPNNQRAKAVEGIALKKLQFLQGRFLGAIHFLKKNVITKLGKSSPLSDLPWHLLIGPSGAGKTTLLVNSNFNFILTKHFKQEKMTPSRTCDWWVTRDYVLIDVPGSYLTKKDNFLWTHFINLIKKHRQIQSLKSIVVAVPLPELNKQKNPQQKKQTVHDIKHKISQLINEFGNQVTFYLVITKCDQIPGFAEFFSECSTEELAQAWGITLPSLSQNETLLDHVSERFNALIKRLNEQLIPRLHQERNANTRPAIKDFPLHMERLKESLCNFIQALSLSQFPLKGIFLTSAKQTITEESNQLQVINSKDSQSVQLHRNPVMPSKGYFIRQIILHGLLSSGDPEESLELKSKNYWQRFLTYAASFSFVIAAAFFLGRDFQKGILQIYAIQTNISQYQLSLTQPNHEHENNLLRVLPLLNALQIACKSPNYKISRYSTILSFYSDKSLKTASEVYSQTLLRIFLPEIKKQFESFLERQDTSNAVELYAVLKSYLMLPNSPERDEKEIASMISQLLPGHINNQNYQDLLSHIHSALSDYHLSLEINDTLVHETRKCLTGLKADELAFIILRNKNNYGLISPLEFNILSSSSSFFIEDAHSTQVANLFTADSFSKVITQDIPTIAVETLKGNAILGDFESQPNDATLNTMIAELRSKYILNYVDVWENLLANVKLATPRNLAETDAIITMLMSNSSPLLQLLQTIKNNTSFAPIMAASPKIQALNTLLANAQSNENNSLYQIFVSLRQLHSQLQGIINTRESDQAAFASAKNRLLHSGPDRITQLHLLADQTPEPMKTWLHTLANQSWAFILKDAGKYVENNWQTQIMPLYHSQLANRFPINPTSTQEADLLQIANLVGKQGALELFYANYLKPFVNDEGKQWQWRVMDNQKLPISNVVLAQIQQTSRLQKLSKYALFTQGHKNLAQLKFQLPTNLMEG